MPTQDAIEKAYSAMMRSRQMLFEKSEAALSAQEALKTAEANIINTHDPKELGANEAARAAKIRDLTKTEHGAWMKAEADKRTVANAHELYCMAVDCLKWQIRATTEAI